MLKVVRRFLFGVKIYQSDRFVGSIETMFRSLRELNAGVLVARMRLDEQDFILTNNGEGTFTLEKQGRVLASAQEAAGLLAGGQAYINIDGINYTLSRRSFLKRNYIIHYDSEEVGSIVGKGWLFPAYFINLPEKSFPDHIAALVWAVAMIMGRRTPA